MNTNNSNESLILNDVTGQNVNDIMFSQCPSFDPEHVEDSLWHKHFKFVLCPSRSDLEGQEGPSLCLVKHKAIISLHLTIFRCFRRLK
jgi:hypothetical protein